MKEKIGHFALGFAAGLAVRRLPAFSVCVTLVMGRYQRLEQNILRDAGYHEMWQYGAGLVAGAIAYWLGRWILSRTPAAQRPDAYSNGWAKGYYRGRQDERRAVLESARIAERREERAEGDTLD